MKLGSPVWHAKRIVENNAEIPKFSKPVMYITTLRYLTVMPVKGLTAIMQYGEKVEKTWRAEAMQMAFAGVFQEGDVMYINGHAPDEELEAKYGYGSSANGLIRNVEEGNLGIKITIEENPNQVKE